MPERTLSFTKEELLIIMVKRIEKLINHPSPGSSNEKARVEEANTIWEEILTRYKI